MSGEGLSKLFSAEWIRATSTLIPVLLALFWVLKLQGVLWRRRVWSRAGGWIREVAQSTGGAIHPRWLGFEVRTPQARIAWVGGLRGETTVVRGPAGTERIDQWLPAERALRQLTSGELSGRSS